MRLGLFHELRARGGRRACSRFVSHNLRRKMVLGRVLLVSPPVLRALHSVRGRTIRQRHERLLSASTDYRASTGSAQPQAQASSAP